MTDSNSSEVKTFQRLSNMLRRIKFQWPFTKRRENGSSEQLTTSNQPASLSGKCITSIHDCSLDRFVTCLCDNDLQALVLDGTVSPEKLVEVWTAIYQEYVDAVAGDAHLAERSHVRKVQLLNIKVTRTAAIITCLQYSDDEDLITELIRMGSIDCRMPKGEEQLAGWYTRIQGRVKRWQQEMETEIRALKELKGTHPDAEGVTTRESIQELIVHIENHVKHHINERETTVGRFVAMIKNYQQYIIVANKKRK